MTALIAAALLVAVPPEKFPEVAAQIQPGDSADAVKAKTESLGEPSLRYAWCNGAGCVEKTNDATATKMSAHWRVEAPEGTHSLMVTFCRLDGQWKVGGVHVLLHSKPGAWGTKDKPKPLFENMSMEHSRACFEGR